MQQYIAREDASAFPLPLSPEPVWQPAMHAIGAWNKTFGAIAKCQSAHWDFMQRRLEADFSLAPRLSRCKSPDEVFDTYAGYWAAAADDYQKQIARSVELFASFAMAGTPILLGGGRG